MVDRQRGAVAGVRQPGAVVDREHHRIDAALGVGVGDTLAGRGRRAVAEVPDVGQRIAVGVGRTGPVERDRALPDDDVGAGLGHRRVVDADLDLVLVDGVDRAAVVGHGELSGVDAGRRVGADHLLTEGRLGLIAEVPAVGGDVTVRVERADGIEGDRLARRSQDVVTGARQWRRVDHHLGLVVVDRLVLVGVVAHRQTDVIDAGLVECVADARAARARVVLELPQVLRDVAVGIERAGGGEGQLLTGGADQIGAGIGDRRRVDRDLQTVARAAAHGPGIVGDRELHEISAGLLVDVDRGRTGPAGAVAEVPFVAGDLAIGVASTRCRRNGPRWK